jgi:hypothetical protein
MEFKTPLEILEVASKRKIDLLSPSSIDSLKQYFLRHMSVTDPLHSKWDIRVGNISIGETKDSIVGNYREIVTEIYLTPDNGASLGNFSLYCDVIIHQVLNQSILFLAKHEIGVISWDLPRGKIFPLHIQLEQGGWFKSFRNMLVLGMQHIKEGTDHLLFLLVLLLPAMLLSNGRQWGGFGGITYSISRLLKIVTAFTIGHSVTLLIGALGCVKVPSQAVEVLIAVSILVSAVHAIYPIFAGKETYVAAGFGLIHGLAFAAVLAHLNLDTFEMVTSILGFNIGIELMQLFVILCTVPWLIVLSRNNYYHWIRILGAIAAIIASLAWIAERVTGQPNMISNYLQYIGEWGKWLVLGLAATAVINILYRKYKHPSFTYFK